MEQIDADVGNVFEKIDSWVDGFFKILPNLGIALVVLAAFWLLSKLVASFVRKAGKRRGRDNLGEVGAALIKWALIIVGVMLSITIVAPSITPADLFAGLGIGSVAIGFAFKDILQNLLAGVLILLRQPFEVGDQIVSGGHEGTVERIETRATLIKTYDGRRVVIPNSDIYTDAVTVNTAFDQRRSQYDVQVGCNDSLEDAKDTMLAAVRGCEGVLEDPAPEALPWAIADSGNNIRLRWWTKPDRASVVYTFAQVIEAVKTALDEKGIDMPYPTQVVLFHDQTEETDGDRSRHREGWPARPDGENPKPLRIADGLNGGQQP
ncbi:mechanosensitive ion channel family protein [Leisingera aquaemixtae]|uniref:Small-conductance mechanosensitive channel n=1 Tax=Leisingera aquaemixtae TaxID=1396826 RepID=A0A0P1HA79_9RHOB|nr:mechanosensitive ion channel family protein [Leisingera aquaemixtae]UWQ41649.1 mechanosensitive ion channel family protein [Leisingera aquaemixtae]CUI00357.1 Small-conductance mechanosensitive channel [Leisingera aquaemixtae]